MELNNNNKILNVKGLKMYFPITKGFWQRVVNYTRAVDGVDFYVEKGETIGLVGESGSGKTTIGRCVVRLYDPTEGSIEYRVNGKTFDLAKMHKKKIKSIRKTFQMLFQDPFGSLSPRMKVGNIISEPMDVHNMGTPKERWEKAKELMERVGLQPNSVSNYPHQFSGGQRQRIGIARALSVDPQFIICDEPVSALDVSVQAQILNLLKDLQDEFGLSYLFIAHDLSVVKYMSKRIMVMYLGKVMEVALAEKIYNSPKHPYTEALIASVSKYKPGVGREILLAGAIPDPSNPPPGCVLHPRCKYKKEVCEKVIPKLESVSGSKGAFVACHRSKELNLKGIDI